MVGYGYRAPTRKSVTGTVSLLSRCSHFSHEHFQSSAHHLLLHRPQHMNHLSPTRVRRRPSSRRNRAGSHLPAPLSQESHDAALHAIRSFLKGRTSYDAFPISFRLIVLDTELNVKKALQCLLSNGGTSKSHSTRDIIKSDTPISPFALRCRFRSTLE